MIPAISPPPERSRGCRFVVTGAAAVLVALIMFGLPGTLRAAPKFPEPENYALSNSVTIALGEEEKGQGLKHITNQKDGLTMIEGFNGEAARVLRLSREHAGLNFYFKIDPAFKQEDASTVRIEVEYLAPQPGTMGVHYD